MRKIIYLILLSQLPLMVMSQDQAVDTIATKKNWDLGGKAGLTLTQTGQVNWVKGGEPALSYLGANEVFANYKKDKHNWENIGKFAYGQQSQGYTRDFKISDDRIDIASKYGYGVSKNINVSFLSTFKSQFASGYEYPEDSEKIKVSEFFSPAYVSGAIGIDYKPNANTSIFASIVSTKTTFVLDTANIDETKYGLDESTTIRNEIGASVKAVHKWPLMENVMMENNVELFSNYIVNPQNVDIIWNMRIELAINKYLKTLFSTTLIYDDDTKIPVDINDSTKGNTKAVQFKEMLSVGLMVSF